MLTPEEVERYSKHLALEGFGTAKQLKLKQANILLVGAGGLGCPLGLYLAASGIGSIAVLDDDCIELSNLARQVAYRTPDIGKPKVNALLAAMSDVNPLVHYQGYKTKLDWQAAAQIINSYDLVIDGTDNFAARFLLADACYLHKVPLLHGAIYQYKAQIALLRADKGPCYRCVFREPPSSEVLAPCVEAGVLGVVVGAVGLLMASEAVKYLTGLGKDLTGKLLLYDALTQSLRYLELAFDKNCPLCGQQPTITQISETHKQCNKVSATPKMEEISTLEAKQLLKTGALLIDVRETSEYAEGHLSDALSLPLSQISAGAFNQLPSCLDLITYCQQGTRSKQAVGILRAAGFAKTYSIKGGMKAWCAQQIG